MANQSFPPAEGLPMRSVLVSAALLLAVSAPARSAGLLIPDDKKVPPLAMVYHRVNVAIEDQVAVTTVEQAFRNHTDRPLEATYVFPVPRGASVNKFSMFVDGKEVGGEMVEAAKARQVYTDIVRRTQDPGLLEYMGQNLLRLRVFPIAPKVDQKVTVRFTAVAPQDNGLVEYVYPIKSDGRASATLQDYSIKVAIKSTQPLLNVYSPTHAIAVKRNGDRAVEVNFDRNQAVLDKDFQLFYGVGNAEIGVTPVTYKPLSTEDGYFLFLISPQISSSPMQVVPRDVVMVLDTSGSMAGIKMDQARKALRQCLDTLNPQDRFAVCNFSTSVTKYREQLVDSSREQIDNAKRWVDQLRTSGGTAIDDALTEALSFRGSDAGRSFTVIFFTDGLPTVGETNPDKILKRFLAKNTVNTRVFTFGVGDDVNAAFLDQLADQTRAVSTYVRPAEDIEVKASALAAKVSQPVLTDLRLTGGGSIQLSEIYPPQLPDLFSGSQMVVLGRYSGKGPAAIRLTGKVGSESREFVYEMNLTAKGGEERDFVEHLWARRKVGYLLDQIRNNGEKKELIEEVVSLAKRYGIATPYTSYLIVPDAPMPIAGRGAGLGGGWGGRGGLSAAPAAPPALSGTAQAGGAPGQQRSVVDFAKDAEPGDRGALRDGIEQRRLGRDADDKNSSEAERKSLAESAYKREAFGLAKAALAQRKKDEVQSGKLGVDLAVESNNLRNQSRLTPTAVRMVGGRSVLEIGGVWIDDGYHSTMKTLTVKAQSPAYFRLLDRHPEVKDVFRLGNHVLWVTPSRTALVIDTSEGKDEITDTDIAELFAAKK
jgi:Ca-activated chloride channel family protein